MNSKTSQRNVHAHTLMRTSGSLLLLASAAWGQGGPAPYRELPPLAPADPSAQAVAPSFDLQSICAAEIDELIFDEPGDGTLWARGADYKARFDGRGATIVPWFGADAPRNYPLAFEVVSATLGDTQLASAAQGVVRREGNLVRIDHGSFVEEYDLTTRSLEQRFVFPNLPDSGDMRVRIAVSSELEGAAMGTGLRFANELGHVDYSQAYVLDAAGRRSSMEGSLQGDTIELRVPESFLATAACPLVIDPLITFFTVSHGVRHEVMPDVSYDVTSDRWCVVWADIWSLTDYDVIARLVTGSGALLDTRVIDSTFESWLEPKIANNNANDMFLVAATVVPQSNLADIRGRTLTAVTGLVGDPLFLSPNDGAYRNFADVGGDPFAGSSSFFCVVWQRYVSTHVVDIESRTVSPAGALGAVRTLNTTAEVNLYPSISSSTGSADGQEVWTVVWQQRHNPVDHDIYGAQLFWEGSIRNAMFPIETSEWDETKPVVSTVLDAQVPGSERAYMVVYERDLGSDFDVLAKVLLGSTVLTSKNLVGDFDEDDWFRHQQAPVVDSDGEVFVVALDERDAPDGPNHDLYTCTYEFVNNVLLPCEVHASLAGSPAAEVEVALHSMATSGGPSGRFFATWSFASANNGFDIQGALWNGCLELPPQGYCFGDGSNLPCPCFNSGASGHGCANSVQPQGALLGSSGAPSVGAGTFVLNVEGCVPNQPGLFFQGDDLVNDGVGVSFGDGLRCAGTNVLRLEVSAADASGNAATTIDIAASAGLGAGALKRYQYWYRDPANSPCGTKFNLSNGLEVFWTP